MRRFLFAAAALIAALSLSPTGARAQGGPAPVPVVPLNYSGYWVPWGMFSCAGSIIVSAAVANWKDNRELTRWEAWSCGLLYWIPDPNWPSKKKVRHHTELWGVEQRKAA
jgi:hypothetical protein